MENIINPLAEMLQLHPVIVLDGALATELERAGCDLNDPLWSAKVLIEAPERIKAVHAAYFAAGADCTITASYQATFEGFGRRGLTQEDAADLMRLAVRLALEARDEFWTDVTNHVGRPKPLVAASVGPYGAFLADGSEYRGDYGLSEAELIAFHRPRLALLAATQADLLAFETIPCLVEAQALTRLLTEFPDRTAWLSFTARDESCISHGERLADCLTWLNDFPQIVAVGINCTHPDYIPALIDVAQGVTDKPIVVYPNAGEGYDPQGKHWIGPALHHTYGDLARVWYQHGARVIGGCCRTTPDDIGQIAAWARNEKRSYQ